MLLATTVAAGNPFSISFDKLGPESTTIGFLGKVSCHIWQGVRAAGGSKPLAAETKMVMGDRVYP